MNKQEAIKILKAILYGLQKSKSIAMENGDDGKLHDFTYPGNDKFTETVASRIDDPDKLTALEALNIIKWTTLKRRDVGFLASIKPGYPEIKMPDDPLETIRDWDIEVSR